MDIEINDNKAEFFYNCYQQAMKEIYNEDLPDYDYIYINDKKLWTRIYNLYYDRIRI